MNFLRLTVKPLMLLLFIHIMLLSAAVCWGAASEVRLSKGQTVYVPVYSNVYSGPKKNPFQLAAMLSIRNTDMAASLRVTTIDYYDTEGKFVRRHLEKPLILPPLGSTHIYLEEKDTKGGFGANFIVRWTADRVINSPVIECVMIGATGGQGISFISPGQEIQESR